MGGGRVIGICGSDFEEAGTLGQYAESTDGKKEKALSSAMPRTNALRTHVIGKRYLPEESRHRLRN